MDLGIKGKTALVCAASKGLGKGCAMALAREGVSLVITARGGTRLADVESALRERGQMLAFEPPHFGEGATLGGAVAAGLSGPGRQAAGALRDFVLGVKVMDGRGDVLSFGGQVMKNVAGYDVSRLMAGSLGTLGITLEVSLTVLPVPVAAATLRLELPEDRAIERTNRWAGKPLPITASAWGEGSLAIRLSGAAAAVREASGSICGVRGGTMGHFSAQSQPMSLSSMGRSGSRSRSGQHHAVPHLSLVASGTGVFAKGASCARRRCGVPS